MIMIMNWHSQEQALRFGVEMLIPVGGDTINNTLTTLLFPHS